MLKRYFDPMKPYWYVIYARMSDKKQNERSPDQQIAEIKRMIKRLKLPWKLKVIYRDDGRKGALIRKRKGFSKMLNEIRSGRLKVDLIVVDTTDRFARSEESPAIRKELWEKYGVLLVTAESSFSDPLTPQGKIYAAVEAFRSVEDNRIKGHQILRSKRDLASFNFWPGGPVPKGLKLKKSIEEIDGVEKVRGSIIVPDHDFKKWIKLAFERTRETGEGPSAIAKFIKQQPGFPPDKDLGGPSVDHWLRNTIYKGVLTYAANCTGIVDDVRKVEPNDPDDILVKHGFCEPIVEPELWDAVAVILKARKRKPKPGLGDDKLIQPVASGYTLSYMLSGLTRCGCCGCSMRPVTSGRKSKEGKSYTYYMCPRTQDGGCVNSCSIPESWLREQVVAHLKVKLFGSAAAEQSNSLAELKKRVLRYVSHRKETTDDPRPQLEAAIAEINGKISGWVVSLGNPMLNIVVRQQIETEMAAEIDRKSDLEQSLIDSSRLDQIDVFQIKDAEVQFRLERLSEVLGGANPTLAHLELSLHVDRIDCFGDGTAVVRFCQLGIAGLGLIETLAALEDSAASFESPTMRRKPRRRARLHAASDSHDASELDALSFWASDHFRFSDLGDHWFESVRFVVPEPTFWSKEHAVEVLEMRLTGLTHEKLAERFGVTVPTIRKAIKIGREIDPRNVELPRKMPRPRWHVDNAAEVYALSRKMMMTDMVSHFKKTNTTLRKAIKYAEEVLKLD